MSNYSLEFPAAPGGGPPSPTNSEERTDPDHIKRAKERAKVWEQYAWDGGGEHNRLQTTNYDFSQPSSSNDVAEIMDKFKSNVFSGQ